MRPVFVLLIKQKKSNLFHIFDLYLQIIVKFIMDLETMNSIEEIAPRDSHDMVCYKRRITF